MRFAWLGLSLMVAACTPTDVGECCQVAAGADPSIVPAPAFDDDGKPANTISTDPKLLCESTACVSYQGSTAYCTESCEYDGSCPKGFVCAAVVSSDPGSGSIGRDSKFCVKEGFSCE